MSALVWVIAAIMVFAGVLAYTGVWKGWIAVRSGYGTYMGFCSLYIGGAGLCAAAAVTFTHAGTALFTLMIGFAVVLLVVAIIGFWWMPAFLQPSWFRRLRSAPHDRGGRR